jgi:hypothetical protein
MNTQTRKTLHSHYTLCVHDTIRLHASTELLIRATSRRCSALGLLLFSKRHARKFIYKRTTLLNAARDAAIARWNVHTRVACEKVARS